MVKIRDSIETRPAASHAVGLVVRMYEIPCHISNGRSILPRFHAYREGMMFEAPSERTVSPLIDNKPLATECKVEVV